MSRQPPKRRSTDARPRQPVDDLGSASEIARACKALLERDGPKPTQPHARPNSKSLP